MTSQIDAEPYSITHNLDIPCASVASPPTLQTM
jgi:hypothetical protein